MTKKHISPKKKLFTFFCSTAAAATFFMMLPQGLLAEELPEKMDINVQASCADIPGLAADKKKVSGFSHKLHAEKYLIGKSSFHTTPYTDDFTCVACHAGAQSKDELTQADSCARISAAIEAGGGAKNYKKQMHSMCIDCHKGMKKAKETTGPTSCKACHAE